MNNGTKFRLKYTDPERVDVKELSYAEMVYYTNNNVYIKDNLLEILKNKRNEVDN